MITYALFALSYLQALATPSLSRCTRLSPSQPPSASSRVTAFLGTSGLCAKKASRSYGRTLLLFGGSVPTSISSLKSTASRINMAPLFSKMVQFLIFFDLGCVFHPAPHCWVKKWSRIQYKTVSPHFILVRYRWAGAARFTLYVKPSSPPALQPFVHRHHHCSPLSTATAALCPPPLQPFVHRHCSPLSTVTSAFLRSIKCSFYLIVSVPTCVILCKHRKIVSMLFQLSSTGCAL